MLSYKNLLASLMRELKRLELTSCSTHGRYKLDCVGTIFHAFVVILAA